MSPGVFARLATHVAFLCVFHVSSRSLSANAGCDFLVCGTKPRMNVYLVLTGASVCWCVCYMRVRVRVCVAPALVLADGCFQVEELLWWGADAQICDRMGYSPYAMALKSNCQATIALLSDAHLELRSVAARAHLCA